MVDNQNLEHMIELANVVRFDDKYMQILDALVHGAVGRTVMVSGQVSIIMVQHGQTIHI